MISNNKEGMYNIRHLTDQYIQLGDSGLIRVEAIGEVNLVFHQLDEHGNPKDIVACVQDVIYTPRIGFNLFSMWKVAHKNYRSVNPTGTQAGRLRFIRGSTNDSLCATRLPPPPLPVDVATESAPRSSACNPPMPVGASRESAFALLPACPPRLLLVKRTSYNFRALGWLPPWSWSLSLRLLYLTPLRVVQARYGFIDPRAFLT